MGLLGPLGPFSFKDAPPILFEGFCFVVKGFWVLFGKLLPFSFEDAPPFLFEGFCVFVKGFWVLFGKLLHGFAGALRAFFF